MSSLLSFATDCFRVVYVIYFWPMRHTGKSTGSFWRIFFFLHNKRGYTLYAISLPSFLGYICDAWNCGSCAVSVREDTADRMIGIDREIRKHVGP